MLNSVINIDLHIHSAASGYKDGAVVSNSDISHLDVLFAKLEENDINLFSITDHNRFDVNLYEAINEWIADHPSSCVKAVLPGVEFDVKFEADKTSCHVIAIFNVKDWARDACAIKDAIGSRLLTQKEAAYDVDEFEALLRDTGLDFMLIAHQHEGLTINPKKKHSLSNSSGLATEMLCFGYIDAVEYNNSRVQGILLDEFHQLELPTTAIVGSDCHSWEHYPAHDSNQPAKTPFSTRVKCLPSFQGLLLAFTSPGTRFQVSAPKPKPGYLSSFSYGESGFVELSPGINAIIGENGSGKSSLLELFVNEKPKEKWIGDFHSRHSIVCSGSPNPSRMVQIKQGQLRHSFDSGSLFSESLFEDVDHEQFEKDIRAFSEALKARVKSAVVAKSHRIALGSSTLRINPELEGATFNVNVVSNEEFTRVNNVHATRDKALKKIAGDIKEEIKSGYYTIEESAELERALQIVSDLRGRVSAHKEEVETQQALRNIIHLAVEEYAANCNLHTTEIDSLKKEYRKEKWEFLTSITNVLADMSAPNRRLPSLTCSKDQGTSRSLNNGFVFQTTAKYATVSSLVDSLLTAIFNKDYQSLSAIDGLDTDDAVSNAVSGSGKKAWTTRWDDVVNKFIGEMEQTERSILDQRNEARIGNTFGEQSLIYYKYKSFNSNDWDLLLVDQPEDDISHSKINSELASYLNTLRATHQIIMVTHNPLLVVNLDVDNVIVLEEKAGKLDVTSGCLESIGILEKVAEHMDGGINAIRRRLRAYEAPVDC